MVAPLRKRDLKEKLYTRFPETEALLEELEGLPRADMVSRCEILSAKSPLYVPTECVLYFVRAGRQVPTDALYERLYKVLIGRLLRQLPKDISGAQSESLFNASVRENALGTFCEWLTTDYLAYCDRLDYFEIRFASGVASLRKDAYRQVGRIDARQVAIESDEDEGSELLPEVERAAGSYNPFDPEILDVADYRSALLEAIESLPDIQRRILHMMMQDIPIDSIDLKVQTISKALGKVEKTIRNQRGRAFATLQRKLRGDQ